MLQRYAEALSIHKRELPVGAEVLAEGGVHFRIWAPRCREVTVVVRRHAGDTESVSDETTRLDVEEGGWFSGVVESACAGCLYGFRIDSDPRLYPDPASRYQPDGPHGLSQVVNPDVFDWTDAAWGGVQLAGQVVYEMHIGTFTAEGTWKAAAAQLPELADLGVSILEVMPVADFPGRFGWGYDGVNLFAPTRLYGTPDDFRRFVDRAHALGLGVILDVVYNHIGPDGNFLPVFSDYFFTDRHQTDWGAAINFEDEHAGPVRQFFLANAAYWIQEFHLDGLRLDATQDIHDASQDHILAVMTRRIREAAGQRQVIVVAENEPQHTKLVRPPAQGGYGIDALWNDDFHHSAAVALSGRSEAYYSDYKGQPQEFISAVKYGYLFQGQRYDWQKKRRGTSTRGIAPAAFVNFIQNHDQVANSCRGQRCHLQSSPGCYRALTALMLLAPGTPMLFQGQEFGSSSPFFFFADHNEELAKVVDKGRKEFMSQFPSAASPETQALMPDPADPKTFGRSKLDLAERQKHAETYQLHRDLIRLRRTDTAFRAQRVHGVDGAVLGGGTFVLRFFGDPESGTEDRLLLVNLEADLHLSPAPEPLLAPPDGACWKTIWSSEDPAYGGSGTPPLDSDDNWCIPGHAAVVLAPESIADEKGGPR